MWLIPPSFPCVGTRWHWKTGAGVGKTGISHFLMFVSFSGGSLQHKWYPVIYSAGRGKERKESQELQKLYGITQLFVESMEEIGTVRDKVTEHDIKWLGLTAKSLCSWGKWNFPSLTCSCCFTEESLPAFICSLPVSTALLERISSPKLVLKPTLTAFHCALVLPSGRWRRHSNGARVRTGAHNEPSIKTTPNEAQREHWAGKRGLEPDSGSQISAAWPECFTCFRKVFRANYPQDRMKVKQLIMCKGSLQIMPRVTTVLKITKAYFYSNCKRKCSKVGNSVSVFQPILCTE